MGIGAGKPFTFLTAVVADYADHLVKIGADLNAACKTDERRVTIVASD